jgi:TolA-binding protein
MNYRNLSCIALLLVLVPSSAWADEVRVKGREKTVKGDIKSESAKEVVIGKETIPAADVLDILYETFQPLSLRLPGGAYHVARDKEKVIKDSGDAAARKAAMIAAIAKYNECLKNDEFRRLAKSPYPARAFEYRIAMLTLLLASADQLPTDKALAKLVDFKAKYPNSWQIHQIMPLVANMQLAAEDWKGAEQTFHEMSEMEVLPVQDRRDAELKVIEIIFRSGKPEQASSKLATLETKANATRDPIFISRVRMYKAELLVSQKKYKEAEELLRGAIKDSTDKVAKAIAHNALGECLYHQTKYGEALWEFLWVDTVYNQDKGQRARALYYLWQTFEQLNNAERAQECRQILLDDPQYVGTEYQRRAQSQTKTK